MKAESSYNDALFLFDLSLCISCYNVRFQIPGSQFHWKNNNWV